MYCVVHVYVLTGVELCDDKESTQARCLSLCLPLQCFTASPICIAAALLCGYPPTHYLCSFLTLHTISIK